MGGQRVRDRQIAADVAQSLGVVGVEQDADWVVGGADGLTGRGFWHTHIFESEREVSVTRS